MRLVIFVIVLLLAVLGGLFVYGQMLEADTSEIVQELPDA